MIRWVLLSVLLMSGCYDAEKALGECATTPGMDRCVCYETESRKVDTQNQKLVVMEQAVSCWKEEYIIGLGVKYQHK